jgi:hypothetical protein
MTDVSVAPGARAVTRRLETRSFGDETAERRAEGQQ